jgi:hypothetical protein
MLTYVLRNLRYSAYRSTYLWLKKKKTKGKSFREALPSCVVNYIRNLYPDNLYTGFIATKSPVFTRKKLKK